MDTDRFIADVWAVDWSSFQEDYYKQKEPQASLIALALATQESREGIHHIKGVIPELLLNTSIASNVMFAIGNGHRGTYYPIVREALTFIIQIALYGNHLVARNCAINIMVDLYHFEPEYAPAELQEYVQHTIERSVLENRENFQEFADRNKENESLINHLLCFVTR